MEHELVGLVCSEVNICEIKSLIFAPSQGHQRLPLKWLATTQIEIQQKLFKASAHAHEGSRMETMDSDCGWNDIARLDLIMPDVGISNTLASMAAESA